MTNSRVYSRVLVTSAWASHSLMLFFNICCTRCSSRLQKVKAVVTFNKTRQTFWTATCHEKLMAFRRKHTLATSCCFKARLHPPFELVSSRRPRLVLPPLLCCQAIFCGALRAVVIDFCALKFSNLLLQLNTLQIVLFQQQYSREKPCCFSNCAVMSHAATERHLNRK